MCKGTSIEVSTDASELQESVMPGFIDNVQAEDFPFLGGHGFFGLGKTEPPILPETSIEVPTDASDFARMRQAPPLPLPEELYNVMGEEPKQERQGMIETPLFAALPTVQFLRGRAKCRRYENKGTCVSKNYMITWRNTHITEVAETSQYCVIFEQPRCYICNVSV